METGRRKIGGEDLSEMTDDGMPAAMTRVGAQR
jgi:hypothetical protein